MPDLKQEILGAEDDVFDYVDVPEWNRKVRIKNLSGDKRDKYEAAILNNKGVPDPNRLVGHRARLVVWSVVDEDGNYVFTDADIPALGKKNAAALDRIVEASQMLSGLTPEAIEELKGNSAGIPNDSGASA